MHFYKRHKSVLLKLKESQTSLKWCALSYITQICHVVEHKCVKMSQLEDSYCAEMIFDLCVHLKQVHSKHNVCA